MYMIYQTFMTGIVATLAMTAVLYAIHWRGFANADMIRAVGSLVTRSEADAVVPGIIIHFVSGVIFAFIYVGFWSLFRFDAFSMYPVLGLITGLAHGLVVSFMLVATVAERHPVERFRRVGLGVAVAHLLGHVVFGGVVGSLAWLIRIRFDFLGALL